ncbi:ABC transporter permease [Engelhardtia mirabilis]|uniref:ABC-2 family transporter protein n=1 Tax=Engelhardtia mirabilis TaxID=2528011 RepID=A0A518BEQ9_9BACT|nr:ABC-2 family transporter protein [Planctomycetes bacterium Pla133]QDU99796.1 ABC-2 family transporter protein [Planctomycetes bacterium Pla86]
MSLLALTHKELREQAPAFLVAAALVIVGCLVTGWLADDLFVDSATFAHTAAVCLTAIVAIAMGCDIGARERNEGTQEWLRRQPVSLGQVALVKLAVLLGALVAAAVVGSESATVASRLFASGASSLQAEPMVGLILGGTVALALWSMACSSFLPRGFLAAPGGACVFALLALPAALHEIVMGRLRPDPPIGLWLTCALIGGALAALSSMAIGSRREWATWKRAGTVALAGSIGIAPTWFEAGANLAGVTTLDLSSPNLEVRSAFLHTDGRHAFAMLRDEQWPSFPVVIDLETGETVAAGVLGDDLWPAHTTVSTRSNRFPFGVLHKQDGDSEIVGSDGEILAIDRAELSAADLEPFNTIGDGGWTLALPAGGGWRLSRAGSGARAFVAAPGATPVTEEVLAAAGWRVQYVEGWLVDGLWIFRGLVRPSANGQTITEYRSLDAEAGELLAVDWMQARDSIVCALADGKALVGDRARLSIVDVREGGRRDLDTSGRKVRWWAGTATVLQATEGEGSLSCVTAVTADGSIAALVRADGSVARWIEPPPGSAGILCLTALADGSIAVLTYRGGQVLRFGPGGDEPIATALHW